jgi:hypothetical protein
MQIIDIVGVMKCTFKPVTENRKVTYIWMIVSNEFVLNLYK